MQPTHLSLVPSIDRPAPVLVQVATDPRKLFWRAYLTWLATATDEETEQFEQVMSEHAHHVRPLMDAITDALRLRATALRLPPTLLAELRCSGWRPAAAPPLAHREGWPVVA